MLKTIDELWENAHEAFQDGKRQGWDQGKAMGEALGEERGILRAMRICLLILLDDRFGEFPQFWETRIEETTDHRILKKLILSVFRVRSKDEFEALLPRPNLEAMRKVKPRQNDQDWQSENQAKKPSPFLEMMKQYRIDLIKAEILCEVFGIFNGGLRDNDQDEANCMRIGITHLIARHFGEVPPHGQI